MKRFTRLIALGMVAASVGTATRVAAVAPPGNTKKGTHALRKNTGSNNTAVGFEVMDPDGLCTGPGTPNACCTGAGTGTCGNSGNGNTAVGARSLQTNTTGSSNTAVGEQALTSNTTGAINTAVGGQALGANTTGSANTAVGIGALFANTTGNNNTAVGDLALDANGTGNQNTAVGDSALEFNTTGNDNTAVGVGALENNDGDENTAVGRNGLLMNTSGIRNTAIGRIALQQNTTGVDNTAVGRAALFSNVAGVDNTAVGQSALFNCTGFNNIGIGNGAGVNLAGGGNNIDIGNPGSGGDSNAIRIGDPALQTATFIAGIRGVTTGVANGITVLIDSNGQLGTISSSRTVKDDIRDIGGASSKVMRLRPVSFRYKPNLDPSGTTQYGLIAEEVAAVMPDLVARDKDGKIETVKYHVLVPLLLNEVQKQHRALGALKAENAALRERLGGLEQIVERLADGIGAPTQTAAAIAIPRR